jgi:hypothetical protein
MGTAAVEDGGNGMSSVEERSQSWGQGDGQQSDGQLVLDCSTLVQNKNTKDGG